MTATGTMQPSESGTAQGGRRTAPNLTVIHGSAERVVTAKSTMVSGVGVVTISGPLAPGGLPACRHAVDSVLRHRPRFLVLDLGRVEADDAAAVPVIAQLRWYVHRWGVTVLLASTPNELATLLSQARVAGPQEMFATVDLAVGAAVTAAHRSPDRSGSGHA